MTGASGAPKRRVFLTHLLLPAARAVMLLVDWSVRGEVFALYEKNKTKQTIFCLNKTDRAEADGGVRSLSPGGSAQPTPQVPAGESCLLGADEEHVWCLFPSVPCLSQLWGSPRAPRPDGADRSRFLLCPAAPMGCGVPLGTWCHCAMASAGIWDGVGASLSAGHCPSDDLGGCLGTWRYSHSKRAGGLFFGNLFSCQRGKLSPTFVFCPNRLCLEEGMRVQRSDRASWPLSHCAVLLEDVPKQAVPGGLCPTPRKLLVWVPQGRLQWGCVSPPLQAGHCQCPSVVLAALQ